MKRIHAFLAASSISALVLMGCGNGQQATTTNQVATPAPTSSTTTTTPVPTPNTLTKQNSDDPIELAYLGISPDKESVSYKIKVNTAKPISQVDIRAKYMDASGKVLEETTLLWQNIVRSKRQPIKRGEIYAVDDYLPDGATRADLVLKRVVFEDGTYWNAN